MVARGVASTVLLRPPRAVLSLLLLATVLLCSPLGVRGAGKSLNAVLKSSWSSTPLEGETAEFVAATTDEEGFWELVENMTTATWKALDTDRDRYQHLLSHVQHKHGTRASALLEVSMANREFSPKLEMYRQLAAAAWQDGAGHGEKMPCAFAVVNGNQIARKVEDVKQLLKSCTTLASNTLEPFDHIGPHRPSEPKGKPVVVLYAKLGSKSWRIWHRRLFELSEELLYVFRHSDCGCGEQTCGVGAGRFNLQGYGVELAIKNIEYKVKDDSALKGEQAKEGDAAAAAATADEEDEVDVEVEGFMFGKLIQKHPALKPELLQFKESLLSSQSFDEPLKVWEMADLSVQASLRVVNAQEPLKMLREVAGYFPSMAKSLTKVPVNDTFKFEVQSNLQALEGMGIGHTNVFAVGGQPISVDGIGEAADFYKVLDIAKAALKAESGLRGLGIPADKARSWLQPDTEEDADDGEQGGGGGGRDATRYDVRTDSTVWLNDLEKDDSTKQWSRSLKKLLEPSYQMQLYIRKNLFSAVVPLDPGSPHGLFALAQLQDNLAQQIPIRIGVVILPGPVQTRDAQWDEWAVQHGGKKPSGEAGGGGGDDALAATSSDGGAEALSPLIARAFHFLSKKRGPRRAVEWARSLYDACEEDKSGGGEMDMMMMMMMMQGGGGGAQLKLRAPPTLSLVEKTLKAFVKRYKVKGTYKTDEEFAAFWEKLPLTKKFDEKLAGAQAWAAGLGLTSLPSLFVNGKLYKGDPAAPADILRQLPYTLREQYPQLVAEVKAQRITDKDDVLTAFCTQSTTRSRILPALDSEAAAALPKPWLPELVRETWTSLPGDKHTFAAQNYIFPPVLPDGVAARHTHWAVVDPTTRSGLRLLVSLVQRVHEGKGGTRAAVWFNPAAGETWSSDSRDFAAAIKTLLMCGASDTQLAEVRVATEKMLALAISSPSPDKISDDERKAIKDILSGVQCSAKNPDGGLHISSDHIMADIEFVSRTFGLAPGGTALLTDGKWHVPSAGEPLFSADLAALELAEKRTERAATLLQALKSEWKRWTETGGSGVLSDIVMAIGSVLPEAGNAWEMPKGLATDYTLLKSDGDTAEGALVRVSAIVNPLTTAAQSIASMLCVLQEKLGSALAYEVLVLPAVDVGAEGKLPMDKYYRFVVASEVGFEPDGSLSAGAGAVFKQLPTTPTLTLGMHTLNSWMIGPESALYDLDNIVLADLGSSSTLYAEWKMLHLLIQGSCASYVNSTDTALVSGAQPTDAPGQLTMEGVASGLELLLGESKHRPHVADTLVMENLGYFQLKAGPGLWYLHMGNKKYELSDKLEGATVVNFGTAKHPLQGAPILVNSWSGSTDTLKVMRVGKLDKYEEQLQSSSFFQPMSNLFSGLLSEQKDGEKSALVKGESYNPDKDPDCIHIYTLASGHAYERFIKIMIQSLLEHTQSKVKFWLLDNFASPQFKDFLPVMAKEYGFYFEFVTYNWPHWLRRQTQKQRVMWGYKILFLDVLFPLEVKRVIFVDADQILRADVKELWDIDLGDAPYGYTPMCSSNKGLEGYMFWKQGFWVDHLQGKPYHISALYVVDLQRFRLTRVGDRLRATYDQLSRDPNSLANLDQDLPNYAQHQVPIFSLPQEWLWCETWCSADTKSTAKTIDMCNNPQTKTPKLENAKRIASGSLFPTSWVEFDERVKKLEESHNAAQNSRPSER